MIGLLYLAHCFLLETLSTRVFKPVCSLTEGLSFYVTRVAFQSAEQPWFTHLAHCLHLEALPTGVLKPACSLTDSGSFSKCWTALVHSDELYCKCSAWLILPAMLQALRCWL